MPIFLASLIGALVDVAGTLVGRVLVSLGLGYATYSGIDTSIGWAKTQVLSAISGLPAASIQIAGMLHLGSVISIMASALLVRLTMQGLAGGTLKKMIHK